MTVISCHVSPTPTHRPDTYLSPSHLFFFDSETVGTTSWSAVSLGSAGVASELTPEHEGLPGATVSKDRFLCRPSSIFSLLALASSLTC